MEEEVFETTDEAVGEVVARDEFSSIRERYESGETLSDDEMDKIADLAVSYLKGILGLFGETSSSIDELILDVNGGDLAVLIGRHGRTLDALQTVLTSLLSSHIKFYYPVVVDIEGYKSRRRNKLEDIARSAAERAKRRHGKVSLAPMNAYERRLVHLALREDDGVVTHSEGEEPDRHVVVTAV
mgnify:CR=1 FL=1